LFKNGKMIVAGAKKESLLKKGLNVGFKEIDYLFNYQLTKKHLLNLVRKSKGEARNLQRTILLSITNLNLEPAATISENYATISAANFLHLVCVKDHRVKWNL